MCSQHSSFGRTKRRIVVGLEQVCCLTRHHFCGRLALWSSDLNDKWGLDVWTAPEPEPPPAPEPKFALSLQTDKSVADLKRDLAEFEKRTGITLRLKNRAG